jgi:hypothetical protein
MAALISLGVVIGVFVLVALVLDHLPVIGPLFMRLFPDDE